MENRKREYLKKGDRIALQRDGVTELFLIDGTIGSGGSAVCYTAFRGNKKGRLKEFYPFNRRFALERDAEHQLFSAGKRQEREFLYAREGFRLAYEKLEQVKGKDPSFERLNNYIPPFELYEGIRDTGSIYVFTPDDRIGVDFADWLKQIHRSRKDADLKVFQILEVLLTLTDAVKMLHQAGLLHLDLKPDNFLIPYNSDFALNTGMLSLFDINSLYTFADAGRFVAGTDGYMAPEVMEGRMPESASDIYSIGCILFHALFLSEEETSGGLYDPSCYAHLDTLVASCRFLDASAATRDVFFRSRLAEILKKSLAEDPQDRYGSCEKMRKDLQAARVLLLPAAEGGKLGGQRSLAIVERERTFDPYRSLQHLLYRCPLYARAEEDVLRILVVGTGNNGQTFLDIALQTGQVLGKELWIDAVSDEAEADGRIYRRFRPALETFVSVDGSQPKGTVYGRVRFRNIETFSETDGEKNRAMAEEMMKNRYSYVFISLGTDERNRAAAAAFAEVTGGKNCAVHYAVCQEGQEIPCAEPVYLDGREEAFHPELERMAFLTHACWSGIRQDARALRREFREKYNHRSSTAYALSVPYKLRGIGIYEQDLQKAAEQFAEKMQDAALFRRITMLEHRRWVMEKVTAGWAAPSDLSRCVQNRMVRDQLCRLHPCIVDSREDTPLAEEPYRSNLRGAWEAPSPLDDGLDDLDRMSVELHRLFYQETLRLREKMPPEKGDYMVLRYLLTGLGEDVAEALEKYEACLYGILRGERGAAESLGTAEQVLLQAVPFPLEKETKKRLKQIRELYFAAIECSMYRDYKKYDTALTEQLPYILTFRPEPNLAMAFDGSPESLELLLELQPKRVTFLSYIGKKDRLEFLRKAELFLQICRRRQLQSRITFLVAAAEAGDLSDLKAVKILPCTTEREGMEKLLRDLGRRKLDLLLLPVPLFSEETEREWRNRTKECFSDGEAFLKYRKREIVKPGYRITAE